MPTRRVGFLLACLLAWIASPATADVIYQYTGKPFTTVTSPYTTSDFVSGTIQLPSVLPANLSFTQIQVNAFSFSDGVQTLTSANSTLTPPGVPPGNSPTVSTDGSGAITAWSFVVDQQSSGNGISTVNAFNAPGDEGALGVLPVPTASGMNSNNPGVWTLVPEPSTGSLSALSLLMLGVTARVRRPRV